jgi:hypothetical protein
MPDSEATNTEQQSSVEVGYLNDEGDLIDEPTDYFHVEAKLSDDDIERLQHGSGMTWEFDTGEGNVGVNIGAKDDTGLGELAFKSHVEDQHGTGAYKLDLASRVVRTRSLWARVAAYTAAFVSAPFFINVLGGSAAVAFTYGVLIMMLMPMLLEGTVSDPMEAAKHE